MSKKHKRTYHYEIETGVLTNNKKVKGLAQMTDDLTDICEYITNKQLGTQVLLYAPITTGEYALATIKNNNAPEYEVPITTKAVIDILRALIKTDLKPVVEDWIKEVNNGVYDEEKFLKDLFPYFYNTITSHEFHLKKENKNGRRRKH